MNKLITFLRKNDIAFRENVPMSSLSSFHTGGDARLVICPDSIEKVECLLGAELSDYIVLGSCTNILVSDKGIDVPVLLFQSSLSRIYEENGRIYAEAGAKLSVLTNFTISKGYKGLEFAGGIPGSVGGGVYMNAGAYGGELKDHLYDVLAISPDGKLQTFSKEECDLSYRHSIFSENGHVVLKAGFELEHGDPEESRSILRELNLRRKEKQPLEFPSAGSTFKRPVGYYAGALIESSSLKGAHIGGAEVSEKHAGFIINKGKATSRDIYDLIRYVQEKVYEKHGVMLEPEVRLIGDFQ